VTTPFGNDEQVPVLALPELAAELRHLGRGETRQSMGPPWPRPGASLTLPRLDLFPPDLRDRILELLEHVLLDLEEDEARAEAAMDILVATGVSWSWDGVTLIDIARVDDAEHRAEIARHVAAELDHRAAIREAAERKERSRLLTKEAVKRRRDAKGDPVKLAALDERALEARRSAAKLANAATSAKRRAATHCARGHSLADAYRVRGTRLCRACKAMRNRAYRENVKRAKEAAGATA
jgi:hypothetical protein